MTSEAEMEPADQASPWMLTVGRDEEDRYKAAGFGRSVGLGHKAALLVIDMQYRTTGSTSMPFYESLKEYSTSCGSVAWDTVPNVQKLLNCFRSLKWPVIYPHVAPKQIYDAGRLGAKVPSIMNVDKKGYEFVREIAPQGDEIRLPKKHPSAFFGTALTSYLIDLGVDTLVVTGCTTSGCVRATVIDAFSLNFRVAVPSDGVYDRARSVHDVNLFDMAQKYADVCPTDILVAGLREIGERDGGE